MLVRVANPQATTARRSGVACNADKWKFGCIIVYAKHTRALSHFLRLRGMKPVAGRRGFHFSLHLLDAEEVV